MNASELRIGNYLQGTKLSIQRLGIESDGLYQITGLGISMIENGELAYEAIPLTKEWIIKLGFYESDNGFWHIEDYIHLSLRYITKTSFLSQNPIEIPFFRKDPDTDIYFVHQLQNLYFALTGNELTIK